MISLTLATSHKKYQTPIAEVENTSEYREDKQFFSSRTPLPVTINHRIDQKPIADAANGKDEKGGGCTEFIYQNKYNRDAIRNQLPELNPGKVKRKVAADSLPFEIHRKKCLGIDCRS